MKIFVVGDAPISRWQSEVALTHEGRFPQADDLLRVAYEALY
jgi:hypothetical protein